MHKIDPREFLKRLPLFSDATPDELDAIAVATVESDVPRNTVIVRRGDPCRGFYVVIFGQVKLSFMSSGGDEKIVEIVGAGQSFGEALMFMERPYIVNAQALADCVLLHIDSSAIFEGLERNPRFARRMLAGMSRRLHSLVSDVEAYSLHSGIQRVAAYLLKEQGCGNGSCITLPVSKKIVASRLNLTPEHFSRVLHELASAGMIAVERRNVTIRDVGKLRAYERLS